MKEKLIDPNTNKPFKTLKDYKIWKDLENFIYNEQESHQSHNRNNQPRFGRGSNNQQVYQCNY